MSDYHRASDAIRRLPDEVVAVAMEILDLLQATATVPAAAIELFNSLSKSVRKLLHSVFFQYCSVSL